MRRSRAFWAGSWAAFCSIGCIAVCLQCGGLEPLPPRYAVPTPDGGDDWFHCSGSAKTAHDAGGANVTPLAFDADLKGWSDRTGVFEKAQPIQGAFVRARDVDPHWSEAQLKLLSKTALRRKSSLVPIGGSYWKNT